MLKVPVEECKFMKNKDHLSAEEPGVCCIFTDEKQGRSNSPSSKGVVFGICTVWRDNNHVKCCSCRWGDQYACVKANLAMKEDFM